MVKSWEADGSERALYGHLDKDRRYLAISSKPGYVDPKITVRYESGNDAAHFVRSYVHRKKLQQLIFLAIDSPFLPH